MTHLLDKFKFCPVCGADGFKSNDWKSKQCPKCGFRYYLNAVSAVAGFIVDADGKVLLCRRAKEPMKDTWDLPGGFVDAGETAESAIVREIEEELNISPTNISYLFSIPNQYFYSGFNVHTLDMFYKLEVADFSSLKPADDVSEAIFLDANDINISEIGLESIKKAMVRFLDLVV